MQDRKRYKYKAAVKRNVRFCKDLVKIRRLLTKYHACVEFPGNLEEHFKSGAKACLNVQIWSQSSEQVSVRCFAGAAVQPQALSATCSLTRFTRQNHLHGWSSKKATTKTKTDKSNENIKKTFTDQLYPSKSISCLMLSFHVPLQIISPMNV